MMRIYFLRKCEGCVEEPEGAGWRQSQRGWAGGGARGGLAGESHNQKNQ